MATAQVLGPFQRGDQYDVALRVSGEGPEGEDIEYTVSVPLAALQGMSAGEQTAYLLDAVKAERERHLALHAPAPTPGPMPPMPETVNLDEHSQAAPSQAAHRRASLGRVRPT